MKRFATVAFFLLCLCSAVVAQTTNATLGGTVSDATKALIPGVTVTATNTGTGVVSSSVTNEAGSYNFPSLQSGTYKVSAQLPGFQTQTYSDIALGVSQQVRLNFTLQVAGQTQSVEVSVSPDTMIATTSSSIGSVLPEYKIRDLPLATRNVLDLVNTATGTQGSNFAGGRLTQLNTTRDGIPVSDGRYDVGAATATYVSPDLVDEIKVIVAPADAETGRGSGQIAMSTRSGTNQFTGSLFWVNRNSKLAANSWLNNFNGAGKNYYNGNQYGGRIGGPIYRNKTFFFFLFDGQRYVTKSYFTGTVLTDQARQGIFRYFPGVQNGNAISNLPTVDKAGNPVKPATATADLTSFSVFGRTVNGNFTPWDPNRGAIDTSGWVKNLISRMPSPNDFTVGDGLNTAGIRWLRRVTGEDTTNGDGNNTNRDQYNVRIDHNFNQSHKASFTGSWERDDAQSSQAGLTNWPGGYNGVVSRKPRVLSASLVSMLSSNVLNEARIGSRKNWIYVWASFLRPDSVGDEARAALPKIGNAAFVPQHSLLLNNIITGFGGAATRGQSSPLWSYADTVSWTHGKHGFKTGFEARFTSSNGFNGSDRPEFYALPLVAVGAGGAPVTGISGGATGNQPGLTGTSVTTAQNLLLDLTGSVSNVTLTNGFNVTNSQDLTFKAQTRIKDFHQNEWSAFFKDDWKVRSNLTINAGLRYDFYGVPYESRGLNAVPVGGSAGLFGISGSSVADMWQPGRLAGKPTVLQLAGKNSPNPDTLFYKNDWNNFAPALGFSWTLPWFGKDKTVLRAGYGINYQGAASYNAGLSLLTGNNQGLSYTQNLTTLGLGATFLNFASPNLPVPMPAPTSITPLTPEPFDVRTNALAGYDDERVNPYIQNFNVEIQRELARNFTLEARYVGSKGTKLFGGLSINDVNIYENGILDAFNITRAGGDAPLFNQILNGLTLNAGTNAAAGQGVVNGTTLTGSAALRANSTFNTFLANGQVGRFASALNASPIVTGKAGGLLARNGFPDNFVVANPQYGAVIMTSNPGSSTYHSLTTQVTKRLSHGYTYSFGYTWSRTLGEQAGDGNLTYADPRNRRLNKTLVAFHRTHDLRSNGTVELPFGPNRKFLANAPGFLSRFVERWQLGGIFSWSSGAPTTITASNSELTFTQVPVTINISSTPNVPNILGNFPKSSGKLTYTNNGATYFPDLVQTLDPANSNVTTLQNLQSLTQNRVIRDSAGNIILQSPAPGTIGTLGRQWIEAPAHANLDVNLVKRIRLAERKEFEIRIDAVSVLNNPRWSFVSTDINSSNFGRLSAGDPTGANQADNPIAGRRFSLTMRLNF
jgi:hypothetical protein